MNIDKNDGAIGKTFIQELLTSPFTADLTTLNGVTFYGTTAIDRSNFMSAKVIIPYKTVLAADETFKLTLAVKHSNDLDSMGAATTLVDAALIGTGVTTLENTYEYDLDLTEYKQYIQFGVLGKLSAADTDSLSLGVVVDLRGSVKGIVTKSA